MSNLPPPDAPDAAGRSRESEEPINPQKKLQAMLAAIWERSHKTVVERIETLREVQRAAAGGVLDEAGRLRAVDAAHKLAGVLGTFGLPRGTDLAREAEETFGQQSALSQATVARLEVLLAELEELVRTAGPTTRGNPS